MSPEERVEAWYAGLTADEQWGAVAHVGQELPRWLIDSLTAAGLFVVSAQVPDDNGGHTAYLMSMATSAVLAEKRPDRTSG